MTGYYLIGRDVIKAGCLRKTVGFWIQSLAISKEMIMSLSRKVLTIYTDRGWSDSDRFYNEKSMIRGYAALNAHIHRLIRDNPNITVHSVSYSSETYFNKHEHNPRQQSENLISLFAVIIYSGEIEKISRLSIAQKVGPSVFQNIQFDDDSSGQGTIIKVNS